MVTNLVEAIEPDYPSSTVDIQTKVDEFRIVGPTSGEVGITIVNIGDGSTAFIVTAYTESRC